MSRPLPSNQRAPLERLIRIAQGESGQCRVVASFLLAWWNAPEYGGFDLTDVWAVDAAIAEDMLMVFEQIIRHRSYPDSLGYEKQFHAIVRRWRPASRKSLE
jgi:hypothetical protein